MKGSLSQFQALFVSTTGTFTRGAMPAANFVDGLTAFEGYPFDNAHEAGKAQVGYLAAPQRLHAYDVQVFKVQGVEIVAQQVGQAEVVVAALVGNIRLVFCQGATGLLVAL